MRIKLHSILHLKPGFHAIWMMIFMIFPLIAQPQNAYIVNYWNKHVAVVDLSTKAVTTTVGVQEEPSALAVNPTGTRVYVCNSFSWTVSVIDATTNMVIATIPVDPGPQGVAVNASGTTVYVANLAGTVSVIDAASNTVVATVPVGNNPIGIVVDPAEANVYVGNLNSGTISVINTATNTVSATINAGFGPYGLAINQAGTLLFVVEVGGSQIGGPFVVVKDLLSHTNIAEIPVPFGPRGIAISPDDSFVYVSHWDWPTASVTVIDASTFSVVTSIPVGGNAGGIDLNEAGTKVYVVCELDELVYEIDVASNTVLGTINAGPAPRAFGNFVGPGIPSPPPPAPPVPLSFWGFFVCLILIPVWVLYKNPSSRSPHQ